MNLIRTNQNGISPIDSGTKSDVNLDLDNRVKRFNTTRKGEKTIRRTDYSDSLRGGPTSVFMISNMPQNYHNTVVERLHEELMNDSDISHYCRESDANGSLASLYHKDIAKDGEPLSGRLSWHIKVKNPKNGLPKHHGRAITKIRYVLQYAEHPIHISGNQEMVDTEFELTIRPTNTGANTIPGAYHFKGKVKNESELVPTAISETKKILQDFGYECNKAIPRLELRNG